MKCHLELVEKSAYCREAGVEPYPVIKIEIYRRGLEKTVRTEALVDTGFDGALVLSRSLGSFIAEFVEPDGSEELDAAGLGIPCDVYVVDVFVARKCFRVKAHAPQFVDLGTIIGRRVLNRIDLCLRGKEGKLYLAESKRP